MIGAYIFPRLNFLHVGRRLTYFIGLWTQKFGFHNVWEFWAYNVVFGLFQAPYYAFSQTMMAELTPPGFDNMVLRRHLSIVSFHLIRLVLRPLRLVKPCLVHDWTQRDSEDHRRHW